MYRFRFCPLLCGVMKSMQGGFPTFQMSATCEFQPCGSCVCLFLQPRSLSYPAYTIPLAGYILYLCAAAFGFG